MQHTPSNAVDWQRFNRKVRARLREKKQQAEPLDTADLDGETS
jgi:hypothetical protein